MTEYGWVNFSPMSQRKEAHQAFKRMFKKYGVPPKIFMDPAKEQVSGETRKLCDKLDCEIVGMESGIKCKGAEATIRRFKHRICQRMEEANSPAVFWCYCGEREALVMNSVVQSSPVFKFMCENQVPESVMTGTPTDISAISVFEWWELVKFKQEGKVYPFQHSHIGRCLGPAPNFGTELCYNVLTTTGKVVPVSTLRSLTPSEKSNPKMIKRIDEFDKFVYERFGDPRNSPEEPLDPEAVKNESNDGEMANENAIDSIPEEYNWQTYLESNNDFESDVPEISDYKDEEEFESYLNAEVLLPQNGAHMRSAKVIGRAKDFDGMDISSYNPNPLLDTRVYNVMFPDGAIEQYASNVIADNILNQVDDEGKHYQLFDKIVDHKTDGTEPKERRGCLSTKGHWLLVDWKYGTQQWIPLKDMKELFPLETAEFVYDKKIQHYPAFAWWLPHVVRKRNKIVSSVRHRKELQIWTPSSIFRS